MAFLNPLNWGKKREPTAEQLAADEVKAADAAELAERTAKVQKQEAGNQGIRALERQLRSLSTRVDDTLKKLDILEKRRDSEMGLMAAADKAGSEARKKMHWRNKKRAEDEIKSLTAHMAQLEDVRSTCERRITQIQRQEDLEFATEALSKTQVDVEEVENVMYEAKAGVENVADVDSVMNSFQLSDEVYDDDEMAVELAAYEESQKVPISEGELEKMAEPKVPDEVPSAVGAGAAAADAEEAEFKRLEKEVAM